MIKKNWTNLLKLVAINGLLLFVFLEVALLISCTLFSLTIFNLMASPRALASLRGILKINQFNEAKFINLEDKNAALIYESPKGFGKVFKPFSKFTSQTSCFGPITNIINSYSCRDKERKKIASSKRTVVLGDFFMQAIQVHVAERLSGRLEQATGREHLNFSASATDILSYFLRYKKLAVNFSHDAVVIGVLPANDIRYNTSSTPHLKGHYPNYSIIYNTPINHVLYPPIKLTNI